MSILFLERLPAAKEEGRKKKGASQREGSERLNLHGKEMKGQVNRGGIRGMKDLLRNEKQ